MYKFWSEFFFWERARLRWKGVKRKVLNLPRWLCHTADNMKLQGNNRLFMLIYLLTTG